MEICIRIFLDWLSEVGYCSLKKPIEGTETLTLVEKRKMGKMKYFSIPFWEILRCEGKMQGRLGRLGVKIHPKSPHFLGQKLTFWRIDLIF